MPKKVNEKKIAEERKNIEIALIDANPDNTKIFNMKEIEELAKNIEEEGFFGSIDVYQKEDGRYEISSGHRRYEAVKLLGYETIPANVSPMPELDTKKRRKLIAANLHNRNMSPLDWARAIEYHYDTLAIEYAHANKKKVAKNVQRTDVNRQKEVAKYFDISEVSVARYLRLNKLIPELKEMVEDKEIPWTSIYVASDFSDKEQIELYKSLNNALAMQQAINDEKGVARRSLSGEQVSGHIRLLKRIENSQSAQEMVEEDIPHDDSSLDVNDLFNAENELDLPVYSSTQEFDNTDYEYVNYIDNVVSEILSEIDLFVNSDYEIKDKEEVSKKLDLLEKNIEEIRKKL